MKDKIAVVIVNYHCQDLVCCCLESIVSLGRDDLSFIIVDNSETPDTDRIQLLHPEATVLRPGSNLGFGGGNNLGIKYALDSGASYVLLMNPDTSTETDFFSPLLEAFAESPRLGMVGPKILYHNSPHQIWSAGGTLNWWIGRPANVYDERYSNRGSTVPVQFLSGCAMMLRTDAVRQVGLMDDRYFLYFEDADYTQRFLRAGWGVAYAPAAEILHAPSSTTGHQSERYVYYFARNRIWFMRRWARWYHFVTFMAFTTIVKLPGAIIIFGLIRRQPELVRAFFRGYKDGLRSMPSRNQCPEADVGLGTLNV